MNKSTVIIFNLPKLFSILNEIKEDIFFNLEETNSINDLKKTLSKNLNNIVVTDKCLKLPFKFNQLVIEKKPIKLTNLIERINIALLKLQYQEKSEFNIKDYILDINSRNLNKNSKFLKLTQKETEIIFFLKNSNSTQSIQELQKKVWGHNSNLETHTVETHIYRLRKKIAKEFEDNNFIISSGNGYKI
tara:strand:+ start:2250 stop:2816 length:567 start_codon:yes stop_codon:yes gene_type:complete